MSDRACPACGTTQEMGHFCAECGTRITESQPPNSEATTTQPEVGIDNRAPEEDARAPLVSPGPSEDAGGPAPTGEEVDRRAGIASDASWATTPVEHPVDLRGWWDRQGTPARALAIVTPLLAVLAVVVSGSGGSEATSGGGRSPATSASPTFEISCYDLMNRDASQHPNLLDTADNDSENDYNYDRCQQPGQENTVVTMTRAP